LRPPGRYCARVPRPQGGFESLPGGELIEVAEDAPGAVARAILAKHGERGFKTLVAVVTAPTLHADGSVLDVPGHDIESGLLHFSDDPNRPRVPANPTPADALAALRFLWRPFSQSMPKKYASMAWLFVRYAQELPPGRRQSFAEAEEQGRQARLGLWADASPVPPWEWRRRLNRLREK
jgi:hypothetical protein